jgi:hypothetical protein
VPTGIGTSYELTVGHVVNMDEAIFMVSPQDSPLLTGVNADGMLLLPQQGGLDQTEFFWMDEEILTPRSTIQTGATTGDGFIVVAAGDRTKFSTGDVIRVVHAGGAEQVRVTGYGTTDDYLLVTRGYNGTTARTVSTGVKAIGLGTALAEGSDPEAARTTDRSTASNYTQIFGPTSVHMSRTEQKIRKYGVPNEFTHQLMNRITENVISREQAFLYGIKATSATTKIRTTGGIYSYVSTNVDSTSTQLTVAKIEAAQQLAYNKGGAPDVLMANPASLADLNDTGNVTVVRTELVESRRGRARVTVITTEFGDVSVARNRWNEPGDALLFKRGMVVRRVLDPLQVERLAKTGDADKVQLVCEEGLEIKGQKHAVRFSNLSYTAAY